MVIGILDIVLLIGGIVLFLFVLNKGAWGKLWAAMSALFGKGAKAVWAADPVAVYRDRLEKITEEIRKAVFVMEGQSALIKQLRRKLETSQQQYDKVDARIKQYIDTDRPRAERYAVDLVKYEEAVKDTKEKIHAAEKSYQKQTETIKKLKEQVVDYRERAGELQSDLELSKAEAELTTLSQRFDATSLEFSDLGEIESEIRNQIDKNRSRSDVSADTTAPDLNVEDDKLDKAAKAKSVLDRYAAAKSA